MTPAWDPKHFFVLSEEASGEGSWEKTTGRHLRHLGGCIWKETSEERHLVRGIWENSGKTWDHLGPPGITWDHLPSPGIIWAHLVSSELIWEKKCNTSLPKCNFIRKSSILQNVFEGRWHQVMWIAANGRRHLAHGTGPPPPAPLPNPPEPLSWKLCAEIWKYVVLPAPELHL